MVVELEGHLLGVPVRVLKNEDRFVGFVLSHVQDLDIRRVKERGQLDVLCCETAHNRPF